VIERRVCLNNAPSGFEANEMRLAMAHSQVKLCNGSGEGILKCIHHHRRRHRHRSLHRREVKATAADPLQLCSVSIEALVPCCEVHDRRGREDRREIGNATIRSGHCNQQLALDPTHTRASSVPLRSIHRRLVIFIVRCRKRICPMIRPSPLYRHHTARAGSIIRQDGKRWSNARCPCDTYKSICITISSSSSSTSTIYTIRSPAEKTRRRTTRSSLPALTASPRLDRAATSQTLPRTLTRIVTEERRSTLTTYPSRMIPTTLSL
jgi:hypothetical protein